MNIIATMALRRALGRQNSVQSRAAAKVATTGSGSPRPVDGPVVISGPINRYMFLQEKKEEKRGRKKGTVPFTPKLMEGLREGQLDLVLSCQPASRYADGFQWTALYSQPTVLAVRCGHPLRSAHSLRQLRDQRWLLQEPLDSSRIGLMFTHYQLAPPEDLLECSAGIIFCELACSTDVISYWPLRMFDYMNRSGPVLEALTIEEEVPGLDISMVYRNRELITRPARLLADELEYVFTHPRTFDEGADPTKRKGLVSIGPA